MTSPSLPRTLARSRAAALAVLLRGSLAKTSGIRIARFFAAMTVAGAMISIAASAGRFGADNTSLSIVATSAAILTWLAGGFGALALSAPPHDAALAEGIALLAKSRGFDASIHAQAATRASVRLLAEVIVIPIVLLAAFVLAIVRGGHLATPLRSLFGAFAFGLVASLVLGLIAAMCRQLGGPHGRKWFMTAVFVPWIFFQIAGPGQIASLFTIPGLLGGLWEALAATPS